MGFVVLSNDCRIWFLAQRLAVSHNEQCIWRELESRRFEFEFLNLTSLKSARVFLSPLTDSGVTSAGSCKITHDPFSAENLIKLHNFSVTEE